MFKCWLKSYVYFWFSKLLPNCPAKETWSFFIPTTGMWDCFPTTVWESQQWMLPILINFSNLQSTLLSKSHIVKMSIFLKFVIFFLYKFTFQNLPTSCLFSFFFFTIFHFDFRDIFHILDSNPLTVKYVADILPHSVSSLNYVWYFIIHIFHFYIELNVTCFYKWEGW